MIGITAFSKTMIRFSSLKHIWVKQLVSVTRDARINNNLNQPIGRITRFDDAIGKQIHV